jgi:NitT/TauT family transport system substrate-binding protein
MPSRRQVLATIAATAATPIGVAACNSRPSTRPAAATEPKDKVVYLTGYGTTPREDYPFVGVAKGFFAEAGIDVTIRPGAPSDANLTTLAAGKAQFASIDFVSAVRSATRFSYRAIAAVQHTTVLSLISLAGAGISHPSDLAGKTLGVAPSKPASQTLFPAYAKLAGVDPRTVRFVPAAPDTLPSLLAAGKIHAMGAYAVDTPGIRNTAHGREPVVLPYSQYLTDLYGTVLITPTDLLTARADLVRRFTAALVKTVRYAVANPDEAGQLVHHRLPAIDAGIEAATMTLMRPYITEARLEPDRVMRGIALLEQAQIAQSGLTPEQVVDFDIAAAVNR